MSDDIILTANGIVLVYSCVLKFCFNFIMVNINRHKLHKQNLFGESSVIVKGVKV